MGKQSAAKAAGKPVPKWIKNQIKYGEEHHEIRVGSLVTRGPMPDKLKALDFTWKQREAARIARKAAKATR